MAAVEVPVQKIIDRYQRENAGLTQRAIIAESAQETLEELVAQLQQTIGEQQQTLQAQADDALRRDQDAISEGPGEG